MHLNHSEPFKLDGRVSPSLLDAAATIVSREFHHFIGDLETLTKSTNTDDKSAFDNASAKLQARARVLKQRFDELSDNVHEKATSSVKMAQAHPWYLAGIGVSLGLAIGVALARKR